MTHATGAPVGAAIAVRLSANGYQVFGTSRSGVPEGARFELLRLDVTDDASVTACVGDVLRRAGRIDVLVNNAGVSMIAAFEDATVAQARAMFETNVFGAMRMTAAVLPSMRERRSGRIVNISSVAGLIPTPFCSLYGATKHALEGFSESLDHELRSVGIRSILIEPGFTRSRIQENALRPDAPLDFYAEDRRNMEEVFSDLMAKAPDPDVVASTVLKALGDRDPSVRYPVGREAALLARLRRFLPTSVFERSFRKQFRLD
ncbi:oxidoreductase [Sphingomonas faeni]|uniref:oxidoreductase n=1 Tax=Sphingomonas faeni TaxID=185950 RepID=UPI00334A7C5E